MVLRTRRLADEALANAALADLCRAYWPPIYAYARWCGHAPHDAEDLTQGFFASLLQKDLLAEADPARGRLRSFLLTAFQRFMVQEWRYDHRQKRGGHQLPVPIDTADGEESLAGGLTEPYTPADLFERRWFETLLERALYDLRAEYAARGRESLFDKLQEHLAWNSAEARLDRLAEELSMTSGALRVAIYRLRQRYRELVEQNVADTVSSVEQMEDELRELRLILGR
jgi:RNA polymerase sigma-70 factor (ECF subfamily)